MSTPLALGLKANWKQFSLLILVNAFVGGMVGMERSIFPQFAATFGVSSQTAMLSFITAFGLSKALANYYTGRLANRFGRKKLLVAGWWLALPVPWLLMSAPNWNWVIGANLLLGLSQGLTWSSTVVMKIDLVGEKDRGFAMGLNEFAGYFAVGGVALMTGWVANRYGLTPYPFYIGMVLSVLGLLLSWLWVRDTRSFVQQESQSHGVAPLQNVFMATTFRNKTLSAVTQAGLVNNLNDGMIWGLLPLLLLGLHYQNDQIGWIAALYPAVWGIGQLFTGKMADHFSKKKLLFWGMLLQGVAILGLPLGDSFVWLGSLSALLGLGTALVYPTFLSTIAEATTPLQRAESIGTFRLWRDAGYAVGAILSGILADFFGLNMAIYTIGLLTLLSALVIQFRLPSPSSAAPACLSQATLRQQLLQNNAWQIIDVRSAEEYAAGHLPMALNLPLDQLEGALHQLDLQKRYVTACAKGGGRSTTAAELLQQAGFAAVWLCGGTQGWFEKPEKMA